MKVLIKWVVLGLIFTGCNNIMDQKFSENSAEEDIQAILESNRIDSTEKKLLAGYIIKGKLSGEDLEELTFSEMLEKAKKDKAEREKEQAKQNALAEKAEKEEAERRARLRDALTVSIFQKDFVEHRYREYLTYKFAFENKTDQEIRAFKGRVAFNDLFDEEISSLNLTYDQPIAAGETITWNGQTEFNQFVDRDVRLKNKDLKDINMVWEPEKIMFTNGESLE